MARARDRLERHLLGPRARAIGSVGKVAVAALALPWDGARAVLALGDDPADELARFDAGLRDAGRSDARRPARVLLCSADAHGYPSYRAAFEAFSMHVPVALGGDADRRRAAAIERALLGRQRHLRLRRRRARLGRGSSADGGRARLGLVAPRSGLRRRGRPRRARRRGGGRAVVPAGPERARGGAVCARAAAARIAARPATTASRCGASGRPWIFTNPVSHRVGSAAGERPAPPLRHRELRALRRRAAGAAHRTRSCATGLAMRLGLYRPPLGRARGAPRIWLHGASAGDLLSLQPMMRELKRRLPGCCILVTT